uniref:UDP-N-acetylglucosamine transferase subunit ALG13 n=1 Tax=Ciona savignyi TaxID=51511 RepID=H2ZD32_CIOSA
VMSVFVTVGTTSFDELVETITSRPLQKALQRRGYNKVTIQYGRGNYEVKDVSSADYSVQGFRYKDSIAGDIANADLVISHAGAGSCLEVLGAGKALLVVVNEKLMDNHQIELAKQLYNDGHLVFCTCSTLLETLDSMNLTSLVKLPEPKTEEFAQHIISHFAL